MISSEEARSLGIYLTVLAAFLAAYGANSLALPSFFLAVLGSTIFAYGLLG